MNRTHTAYTASLCISALIACAGAVAMAILMTAPIVGAPGISVSLAALMLMVAAALAVTSASHARACERELLQLRERLDGDGRDDIAISMLDEIDDRVGDLLDGLADADLMDPEWVEAASDFVDLSDALGRRADTVFHRPRAWVEAHRLGGGED